MERIQKGDVRAYRVAAQSLDRLRREMDQRLDELERQTNRAAVVDDLPANAPLGALIRLRGDQTGALYLGNGPTRPVTKLLPV